MTRHEFKDMDDNVGIDNDVYIRANQIVHDLDALIRACPTNHYTEYAFWCIRRILDNARVRICEFLAIPIIVPPSNAAFEPKYARSDVVNDARHRAYNDAITSISHVTYALLIPQVNEIFTEQNHLIEYRRQIVNILMECQSTILRDDDVCIDIYDCTDVCYLKP